MPDTALPTGYELRNHLVERHGYTARDVAFDAGEDGGLYRDHEHVHTSSTPEQLDHTHTSEGVLDSPSRTPVYPTFVVVDTRTGFTYSQDAKDFPFSMVTARAAARALNKPFPDRPYRTFRLVADE